MTTFNLFKFSAKAEQLIQFFGVSPEFASEVETLLQPLSDIDKKYIYKYIKNNKITSIEKLQELKSQIQKQTQISQTKDVDQNTLSVVQQITTNAKYQKWLANLIQNNLLPEEDIIKTKDLLEDFTSLSDQNVLPPELRDIFNYKSVQDLYKVIENYSAKTTEGKLPPLEIGYKIIEDNGNVKLIETFTSEAITAIAKMRKPMANWCVARGTVYEPNRYYCFIINGLPEILVHPESEQIKDYADDTISNLKDIEIVYPYLEEYDLFPDGYAYMPTNINEVEPEMREDMENSDFFKLKYKKTKIELIKTLINENSNESDAKIKHEIIADPSLISLAPDDKILKYLPTFHYVIEHQYNLISKNTPNAISLIKVEEISKKALAMYLNWAKINNKDLAPYNAMMIAHISKPLIFMEYTNTIPDNLKTPEIKSFYRQELLKIESAIAEVKQLPQTTIYYFFKQVRENKVPDKWIQAAIRGIEKLSMTADQSNLSKMWSVPDYYYDLISNAKFPENALDDIKNVTFNMAKNHTNNKALGEEISIQNNINKLITIQDQKNIISNSIAINPLHTTAPNMNMKNCFNFTVKSIAKRRFKQTNNLDREMGTIINGLSREEKDICDKFAILNIHSWEIFKNTVTSEVRFIQSYAKERLNHNDNVILVFEIAKAMANHGIESFQDFQEFFDTHVDQCQPNDIVYVSLLKILCSKPSFMRHTPYGRIMSRFLLKVTKGKDQPSKDMFAKSIIDNYKINVSDLGRHSLINFDKDINRFLIDYVKNVPEEEQKTTNDSLVQICGEILRRFASGSLDLGSLIPSDLFIFIENTILSGTAPDEWIAYLHTIHNKIEKLNLFSNNPEIGTKIINIFRKMPLDKIKTMYAKVVNRLAPSKANKDFMVLY